MERERLATPMCSPFFLFSSNKVSYTRGIRENKKFSGGLFENYIADEEEDGFDSTTVSDFQCDGTGAVIRFYSFSATLVYSAHALLSPCVCHCVCIACGPCVTGSGFAELMRSAVVGGKVKNSDRTRNSFERKNRNNFSYLYKVI